MHLMFPTVDALHDLLERVFHTKGKSFIATNYFRTCHYVSDNKALKPIYFRNHLINSLIGMVLSS